MSTIKVVKKYVSMFTRAIAIVLVLTLVSNLLPLQFIAFFAPQAAQAATSSYDFSGGTAGSGDSNIVNPSSTLKLKPDWYYTDYNKRQLLTVNSTDAVSSGYSVKTNMDLATMVDNSLLRPDLKDLRVGAYDRTDGRFETVAGAEDTSKTGLDRDIVKGQAISLNGSSQYIDMGDPSNGSLDFGASTDFTVEAWIKTSATGIYQEIFDKRTSSSGYFIGVGTNNKLSAYIRDSATAVSVSSSSTVTDGSWHHVAAVFDRDANVTLYIDGQADGSPASISAVGDISHTGKAVVGYHDPVLSSVWSYFNGTIDEVRASNSVRYSSNFTPRQAPFNVDANTVGLWHLDNNANDSSVNGNNGSLTGSPYYIEGKVTGTSGEIWFKTLSGISASSTSEASGQHSYYVYNNYSSAGSPEENPSNVYNYSANFDSETAGQDPSGWTLTETGGDVSVYSSSSYSAANSMKLDDTNSVSGQYVQAYKNTPSSLTKLKLDYYWFMDSATKYYYLYVLGDTTALTFSAAAGSFKYYNGSAYVDLPTATSYSAGQWYHMEFYLNAGNASGDTIDVYVNGSYKGQIAFRADATYISRSYFNTNYSTQTGYLLVDNVITRPFVSSEPTISNGTETSVGTSTAYSTPGVWTSNTIAPTGLYDWGSLAFTATTPASTAVTVDVLRSSDSTVLASNVASGTDLNTAGVSNSETSIKLRANLSGGSDSPTLSALSLGYSYDTTAPSDPSSLAVGTVGASSVALSWTGSTDSESGVAGYKIERAPDSGGSPGSFSQIDTSASASYTDSSVSANTKYWYKVRAYDNASNNSGYTSNISTTTLANTPASPAATPASSSQINLSWSSGGAQDHYHVYSSSDSYASAIYNSTTASTSQSSLSANTQYTYRIYGVNSADVESSSYATVSKYTNIQSPTGASWDSVGKDSITLSASGTLTNLTSGTSGLYFENTTSSTNSGWTQTNTWSNGSLLPNTSYAYQITSRNGDGSSNTAVSAGSKYTLAADPSVSADKSISTWYGTTDVVFTNAAGFGAGAVQYYRYAWDQSATHTWADTETQWTSGTLTKTATGNGSWYLHVKSYNAEDAAGATADLGPYYYDGSSPTDPTGFGAVASSASQVDLSWTASTDSGGSLLAGYKIERAADSGGSPGSFSQIDTTTSTTYSDTSRSASTKYWYKIRAYDNVGNNSGYTSNTSIITLPNVAASPLASAASTTQINLSWSSGGAQDHYHVYSSSDSYASAIYNSTAASASQSSLSANTQYTYRIYGANADDVQSSTYASASKYTLAIAPNVSADKSTSTWYNTTDAVFTNAAGFGAGYLQYYRYVWDQNATHTWADTETQWTTGTLTKTATGNGSWYVHVKSYNNEDAAGSTADYGPYYYDGSSPTDPSSLVASAASTSQLNLTWSGSTDSGGSSLSGYKVERAADSGGSPGSFSQIDTSASASYNNSSLTPNTKYWYRVRAYDGATNNSGYSSNTSKTTLSDPPTLPVATDAAYSTKINVSWTASISANHYHVYRDGMSGSGTLIYNTSGTSFDDTITGSHTYYIYAVNSEDAENSNYISDLGSTEDVPTAPTIGTPTALSTTSIRWNFTDNASNETGFKLHDGSNNLMASGASVDLTYLDESSLSANTQYTRHVHSYNGAGDSSASSSAAMYTLANTPGAPTVSSPTTSSLTVAIDVNSNPAATTYAIFNNTTGTYVQADATLGASAVYQTYTTWGGASGIANAGLSPNTSYTYKVIAKNGDSVATSFGSNSTAVYTLANTPTSPSATPTSSSQMNLSWSSGGSQDHYHVYSSSDSYASAIYNSTTTSTSQSSLSANTQYTYRIYGVNASNVESSTYASVAKYTLADPPTLPIATDAAYSTKINVSWTASISANHYHVYRDGVSGSGTLIYNTSGTSFDDTITGSHTYYIYAVNSEDAENSNYISDSGSTSTSTPSVDPPTPNLSSSKSISTWYNGSSISFSSNISFGSENLSYYRYSFNEISGYAISAADTQWTSGVLSVPIVTSGIYYLHVKAYSSSDSASSQVTYGPYQFDIAEPTVRITSHGSGDYVKGVVSLSARATDNIGIADVAFYDNSLTNQIGDSQSVNFDTRKYNGARTIYAKATDYAGNSSISFIILNVDNVKPKPSDPTVPGGSTSGGKDDGVTEVKKGESVKIYFKIKDNFDKASAVAKIHRRLGKTNSSKLAQKTLQYKTQRTILRLAYSKVKAKKDLTSKRKAKLLRERIKSLNKLIKKSNPFKLKKSKTYDLGEVDTNKKIYFKYSAKKRGMFRIAIYVYDQANNTPSTPIIKWLKVR